MENVTQRLPIRFGLRTLLILITLIALSLGWWSSSAMKQSRATVAISTLGGSVTYDYQAATGVFNRNATPAGPLWLRRLIGRDWFDTVHGVGFRLGQCTVRP